MAVRTVASVAGALDIVLAYGFVDFAGGAEGADGGLLLEVLREGEGWLWSRLGVEDLIW